MPITLVIEDPKASKSDFDYIFSYFGKIDERFSPFKEDSEVSKINKGQKEYSLEMKEILKLCEQAKKDSDGYFDVWHNNTFNPSGLVKGWAIYKAANLLKKRDFQNYYVDAGGDIQVSGRIWKVGIRNPFKVTEIVKVVNIQDQGIATSGIYERGEHIYNPLGIKPQNIVSMTVIGPDVMNADILATTAFAMDKEGINFVERQKCFEGYMIDKLGIATYTSGFKNYETN